MDRDLTKRYVDEVLEVSGVKKKGADRIPEIYQMSDQEIKRLGDCCDAHVMDHYKKNFNSILRDLRGLKERPIAHYFGSLAPIPLLRSRSCAVPCNRSFCCNKFSEALKVVYPRLYRFSRLSRLPTLP